MDGLVSTGNKFPSTILKIIFFKLKKSSKYFIHILKSVVDKPTLINAIYWWRIIDRNDLYQTNVFLFIAETYAG